MNERLEEVVAELARQLGVGAGELWDYLRDGGLQAYCQVKVVQKTPLVIGTLVMTIACIVGACLAYRHYAHLDDYHKNLSDLPFVIGTLVFVAFIVVMFFIVASSELIGWLVVPDGMIIDQLIGAIK